MLGSILLTMSGAVSPPPMGGVSPGLSSGPTASVSSPSLRASAVRVLWVWTMLARAWARAAMAPAAPSKARWPVTADSHASERAAGRAALRLAIQVGRSGGEGEQAGRVGEGHFRRADREGGSGGRDPLNKISGCCHMSTYIYVDIDIGIYVCP